MWGIIPAAGAGSRIQPLAFSKELLPVGSCVEGGRERPRAVSEYLVERMILAGATKLCFVISPGKTDILEYYGSRLWGVDIAYVVQPSPGGLCDALFRALPLVHEEEQVLIGLPDTIWNPKNGFSTLPADVLSFLLFPVKNPELFDAVVTDANGSVEEIQVKQKNARSNWIWGGIRMPGRVLHDLHAVWCRPDRRDEYFGTVVNAWLQEGGEAVGIRSGQKYVDVGTVHGYRAGIRLLSNESDEKDQSVKIDTPDEIHGSEREVNDGRHTALTTER
jgi:glucose-1-phosphate thymidylyltransferase